MRYLALSNNEYETLVSKIEVSAAKINNRLGYYASVDSFRHECTNYDYLIQNDSYVKELCDKYQRDTIVCYLKLIVNERIAYVIVNRNTRIFEDNTKEMQRLNERVNTLEFSVEMHSAELAKANDKIDSLNLRMGNATSEIKNLNATVKELKKDNALLLSKLDKALARADEQKSIIAQQDSTITELRARVHALEVELKETNDALEELVNERVEAKVGTLKLELSQSRARVVELETQVVELETLVESQAVQLESQAAQLESQAAQLESQAAQLAQTKTELAQTKTELAQTKTELNAEMEDIKSYVHFSPEDFDVEVTSRQEAFVVKTKVQRAFGFKVLALHHLVVSTPANSTAHQVRHKQLILWLNALTKALQKCQAFVDVSTEHSMLNSVRTSLPVAIGTTYAQAPAAPKRKKTKGFSFV